jgi:hypothetical protein
VTRLDETLIQCFFSPVAGWAEHRLGVGQWRLAIESLNGHLAFYLAGLAFTIGGKGADDGIFTNLVVGLAWLLLMDGVRRVANRQAGSSIGIQTARLREWHFRLIVLAMLPVSLCYVKAVSNLCYTLSLFLLLCHLYFKACDAPPPQGRRKLAFSRL